MIEEEADDAEIGFVVMEIEFGADGRENFRIDGEVEHSQVTPVRGQKRLQHRWREQQRAWSMEHGAEQETTDNKANEARSREQNLKN